MVNHSSKLPDFLDRVVEFPDGFKYELGQSLTDYRKCHDGIPIESRILFTCRRLKSGISASLSIQSLQAASTSTLSSSSSLLSSPPLVDDNNNNQNEEDEYVIKIKVQVPDSSLTMSTTAASQEPHIGPSTTTAAEIDVLGRFRDANSTHTPHLVSWKKDIQDARGPLPGGFITYLIMTKMPGQSLFNSQYWNKSDQERNEIVGEFYRALKWVYSFGIEPLDCGLRNVLWEPKTKKCTIIDFELWREATGPIQDRTKELQRWGLVRRPPPRDWWSEWNMQGR